MNNPRNLKVRLGYALASLLGLVIFNLTHLGEERRSMQREYDQWFGELEPRLHNPALTGTPLPPLSVQVESETRGLHLTLALTAPEGGAVREQVLRILQMAREANLFSIPGRTQGEITFAVQTEARNFTISFNPRDIESNPQAQAMLKLLQIYSTTTPKEPSHAESN